MGCGLGRGTRSYMGARSRGGKKALTVQGQEPVGEQAGRLQRSSKLPVCPPPGTYLTHEAKGSDDAPDADTAIINAEGGQSGGDDKKEYFI